MLSDPATIEAVMVTQTDVFMKGKSQHKILHDLFGDGIINAKVR
jgi:hypothetical protein